MMKSSFLKGVVAATIALPALSGVARADGFGCSNATLKGLYMFAGTGYTTLNGSLVPIAVTGKDIIYGNGKFDSLATLSVNGAIVQNDAAPGTYSVNSDCTATATVHMTPPTPDVHLEWFVTPDGDQIFYIQTDPGNVGAGTEPRVAR
jgi:hypothetical protein